jgi:hypothetical protein
VPLFRKRIAERIDVVIDGLLRNGEQKNAQEMHDATGVAGECTTRVIDIV